MKKEQMINQVFKVPNNEMGKFFVAMAKQFISPCYSIKVRGRTLNDKKLMKEVKRKRKELFLNLTEKQMFEYERRRKNNDGGIPLSMSDNMGIYICLKKNA